MSNSLRLLMSTGFFLIASSILIYANAYGTTTEINFTSMIILFCMSFGVAKEGWSVERIILLLVAVGFTYLLPIGKAALGSIIVYTLVTAVILKEKTFANFFGPMVLIVLAVLSIAFGAKPELINSSYATWGCLLVALFGSGRSSFAAIIVLVPFILLMTVNTQLESIHDEVAYIYMAWCLFEISQKNLRRMAISFIALALWLSPTSLISQFVILVLALPQLRFLDQERLYKIAIMLAALVAFTSSYASLLTTLIAALSFLNFVTISKSNASERLEQV